MSPWRNNEALGPKHLGFQCFYNEHGDGVAPVQSFNIRTSSFIPSCALSLFCLPKKVTKKRHRGMKQPIPRNSFSITLLYYCGEGQWSCDLVIHQSASMFYRSN